MDAASLIGIILYILRKYTSRAGKGSLTPRIAMAPSPYRYRALQIPSTIRLLKILPELKDGEIACTLEHFQDDAVPPYHTLSYVWGDPKKTRQIRIKDAEAESWHKHGLHESLWEFLDQMHTLYSLKMVTMVDFHRSESLGTCPLVY